MSDCNCIYSDYDGDAADFYDGRWVTARKDHRCMECRLPIAAGSRYYRVSGKWDGDVATCHFCAECWDIGESLYCDSRSFGSLWEHIEDQIFRDGGLTVACIDKLTTPEAKAKLQHAWTRFVERRAS